MRAVFWGLLVLMATALAVLEPSLPALASDQEAARVIAVTPGVFVERDGQRMALAVKDSVFTQDTIVTDATGKAQILFRDDTTVAIAPGSTVHVSQFSFGGNSKAAFGMRMGRGMSRVVTGRVVEQNREGFQITTPHATVGIRGTILTPRVTADATTVIVSQIGAGHTVSVINTQTGQISEVDRAGLTVMAAPSGNVMRPSTSEEKAQAQTAARQTGRASEATNSMFAAASSSAQTSVSGGSAAVSPVADGLVAASEPSAEALSPAALPGTNSTASTAGSGMDRAVIPPVRSDILAQIEQKLENALDGGNVSPGGAGGDMDEVLDPFQPGEPGDTGDLGPNASTLTARYRGEVTGQGQGNSKWDGSFNFDVNLGTGAMNNAGLSLQTSGAHQGLIQLGNGSGQMHMSEGGFSLGHFERTGQNTWGGRILSDVEAHMGGQFSGDRSGVNVNSLEVSSQIGKIVESGSGKGEQTATWSTPPVQLP